MNRVREFERFFNEAIRTNQANKLHLLHLYTQLAETCALLCELEDLHRPILRNIVRQLKRKVEYLSEKIDEVEATVRIDDEITRLIAE